MSGQIPKLSPIVDESTLSALAEAIDRRKPPNGIRADLVKLVISLLASALLAYGVVNARVAVLESRVNGVESMLNEMRQDIKTLLQRVR